jgi:complement component 1 Q subcomponent-binding protein
MLTRTFSLLRRNITKTNIRLFSAKVDGLKKIISSEIDHEEKNYSPVDQGDLDSFYKNSNFKFTESDNSTRMELTKSESGYDIIINFSAKPPFPQEEAAPENQEEKQPENMTEFSVRVCKKGEKSGLLIDATLIDASFEFNSIQHHQDVHQAYDNFYVQNKSTESYTGPEFNTLDERVQAEFSEFLSSIGINEELGSFMQVLSVDKDQRLYLGWLKNVKKFLH